jgi:phage-related minor tail protein
MADIAEIGARFDSSELKEGGAAIRALVPPAKQAEAAVDKLETALGQLAAGAASADTKLDQVAATAGAMPGQLGSAAAGARSLGGALGNISSGGTAERGVRGLGSAIEAAGKASKLTTADMLNLGRQGADVGVTLAMGMNPFMVAIQQGPQILDALQVAAIRTQSTVGGVFKQLLATVMPLIVSVGLLVAALGLVAAGFALWSVGEKSALGYEKAVSGVGRAAGITATQLRTLTIAGAEQGNISIKAAQEQATAYLATGRIGGEVISGLLAIGKDYASFVGKDMTAATKELATAFADPTKAAVDLTRQFGLLNQEQIKQIKSAMQAGDRLGAQRILLDALTVAAKGHSSQVGEITNAWDAVGRAISNAITKLGEFMYMTESEKLQRDINFRSSVERTGGPRGPGQTRLYNEAGARASGVQSARAVREAAAAERARVAAANMAAQDRVDNAATRSRSSGGKTSGEKFSDIVDGSKRDAASVQAQIDGINKTTAAAALLTNQQRLLNEAASKGLTLTPVQTSQLMALAGTLTDLQEKLRNLEGFKEISEGAAKQLTTITDMTAEIGLTGEALYRYRAEMALLNEATAKHIELDATQRASLIATAAEIGKATAEAERMKFVYDAVGRSMETTTGLKEQLSYIGLNADEVIRLRNENVLLAAARAQNINLTPDDIAALKQVAGEQSNVEIAIRRTTEALDFAKSATRGFIGDLASGLKQGESLWRTFGNAVVNVLNKVLDKLLDAAVDGLFSGGKGKGGGGFLSTIFKAAMSGLTGGGKVTAAAKGEVLGRPTMIAHAAGATLAGEAGKEAVVPLQRGPDGSLGVQMYGGGAGGGGVSVHAPINVYQTFEGVLSGADVQNIAKGAAQVAKDEMKREVVPLLSQYQRDGAIV